MKKFGKGGIIALSLHPLSRERARGKEVKRGAGKKSLKKKFEKFGERKTSLTFAAAFERGDGREDREREKTRDKEFFKILR